MQLLAPEDWWRGWCNMVGSTRRAAGQWEPKFLELSAELQGLARYRHRVHVPTRDWFGRRHLGRAHGLRLGQTPPMHPVCLDGAPAPAPATPRVAADAAVDSSGYEDALLGRSLGLGGPIPLARTRWRQPSWPTAGPAGGIRIEGCTRSTGPSQGLRSRLGHSEQGAPPVVPQLQEFAVTRAECVRSGSLLRPPRLARWRGRRVRTTGLSRRCERRVPRP